MKKKHILIVLIIFMYIPFIKSYALINPSINNEINENEEDDNKVQYKKLEDLKKELKEQRKAIEQQRLEEIKAKELEKSQNLKINSNDSKKTNDNSQTKIEVGKPKVEKKDDEIPTLIVRLRGKHSSKYLCYYNFKQMKDNEEKILAKEILTDYEKLLKKPALKVRPGEIINFEFSEKPKYIKTYIWNHKSSKLKIKKGCIKVPDLDEKIVVAVDGVYKNGYIRYAIVLDIRK